MTRPLAITARQARALLKAAKAEGGVIEVKTGDVVVRLIPEVPDRKPDPVDEDDKCLL